VRILYKKTDETLIPEFIEVTPKTLKKKKINLNEIIILLDDIYDLKYLDNL